MSNPGSPSHLDADTSAKIENLDPLFKKMLDAMESTWAERMELKSANNQSAMKLGNAIKSKYIKNKVPRSRMDSLAKGELGKALRVTPFTYIHKFAEITGAYNLCNHQMILAEDLGIFVANELILLNS